MGRRGPKKTPAPIKKARGTFRPDRDSGAQLPEAVVVPDCPAFLSDEAQSLWHRLGPNLVKAKLLTDADVMAFALLCQAWADWIYALEKVEHYGITSITDSGSIYQHPAVGVRNKAWTAVMKGCQEFGLTPSSRSGPVLPKSGTTDGDDPDTLSILGIQ
jgi:P27 family predicted phage terminase small subunit